MSSSIFCRRAIKQRLYFQSMPSTYAVLGYSPHTVLLGRGFPPQAPAWRTAPYLALYHYSFHYFFLDFSTTRGATGSRGALGCSRAHFNPRTPCGVRRPAPGRGARLGAISIHAPLTGCDPVAENGGTTTPFSIHAPLTGCDDRGSCNSGSRRYFNPRTPRGVRLREQNFLRFLVSFQSTHPLRGATRETRRKKQPLDISIHAPLAGCDRLCPQSHRRADNFNPRTPCGVRRRSA